jgi:uncharacterized protein (TIGR02246 family)
MPAHHAIASLRSRVRVPSVVAPSGRTLAIHGTMLALALVITACDGASSPSAPDALAAEVSNASMSAADDRNGPTGDYAAVAAVGAAWDAAWNAGDAAGLAALFVEDAEFINGRGQIAIGAATIRAQHAASLAGMFRGSRSRGTVRRITFLSGTTAVLDIDNELTGFQSFPGGQTTEPGLNRGRHKRVLVKRAGQWRTILMQLTSVAPVAPAP